MIRRSLAGGSHWRVSRENDLDLMIVLMHVGFILKIELEEANRVNSRYTSHLAISSYDLCILPMLM